MCPECVNLGVPLQLFGRHENTIRGWLQSGALRGYKLHGKEWRVSRSAIREFHEQEAESLAGGRTDKANGGRPAGLSAWKQHLKDSSD